MPTPPVDWFAVALARCADLPERLAIRQRLARLEGELARREVAPDDPRVPGMIAALFPPGTAGLRSGSALGHAANRDDQPWSEPGQRKSPSTIDVWLRRFTLRRTLRLLRYFAPLLVVLLAADMSPVPPYPPPVREEPDKPFPKPTTRGHLQPQKPLQVEQANPEFYRSITRFVGLGILLWLTLLFLRSLYRQRLAREANPDVDPVIDLAVRLGRGNLFGGAAFDGVLKQMRLRRVLPGYRLDLRQSLRATIARGGLPDLRYGVQRLRPEYLILSEREMVGDHLPEIGRALRARLTAGQVDVQHYEFQGAPQRLRHDHAVRNAGFEPVEAVMARHSGARVLISAESYDLADWTGATPPWIEAIAAGQRPVLLNPRAEADWHDPENRLVGVGFGAVQTTAIDPRLLAKCYADAGGAGHERHHDSPVAADLPEFLAEDREVLLSEVWPDDEQVEAIVANLEQHWLDKREMRWLRTLALFPALHPSLTYFAGMALFETEALPLESYLRLIRLPWFRAGQMPDWMRQALVRGMDPEEFETAKRIVQAFFAPEAAQARSARDIMQVCDATGNKRRRKRFASNMARSNIPALRDGLLIDAFGRDDPAEVEFVTELPAARRQAPWMATAVAATLGLALFQFMGISPTRVIEQAQDPVWVKDQEPTPETGGAIPNSDAAIDAGESPSANDGTMRQNIEPGKFVQNVVFYYAKELDAQAAAQIVKRLEVGPFKYTTYSIIYGFLQDQSRTYIRCYNHDGCTVAANIRTQLLKMGISSQLDDYSRTIAGTPTYPTEVYFADKDLADSTGPAKLPDKLPPGPEQRDPAASDIPPRVDRAGRPLSEQAESPVTQSGTPSADATPRRTCNIGPHIVFFDWGSIRLTAVSISILNNAVGAYNDRCTGGSINLNAMSAADERDNRPYLLSDQRAEAVADYLVKLGLPARLIARQNFSEINPRVPSADGVREQQNRRVEITFGPPPPTAD